MRTGVENSNAEIKKNHAFMDRGYTHVFGLAKNSLLLAFGLASVNIRLLRHWHARRGQPLSPNADHRARRTTPDISTTAR